MKNKKLILAAALLAAALCGTAVAYMFKVSQQKNSFIPAQVSCTVHEKVSASNNRKTEVTIENTGNITAYLRLRLVTYWVNTDADDNEYIVAKASKELSILYDDSKWKKGFNDTYYFINPVDADKSTENLLTNEQVIELEKDTDGNRQVVEIFAEAIQAEPVDAVISSWGVTLDAKGNISAVS